MMDHSWLWTTDELVTAMSGRPVGHMPQGITGISIDSRSITPGEAFFAIKGDRVDGHNYATFAVANGAALLVVAEGKLAGLGRLTVPMIVVDDVLAALARLGMAARDRVAGRVIAVTGSVGKTTTKEMLRHVLSPSGKVHASAASFNNHWGVPLTLARMPRDTDYGVFEIGMNHPDEIRPLVKMVRPHVGIITSIAAAHLGNFASLEEIAHAKAELMEGVVPGGHAILNRDSEFYPLLEKAAQDNGIDHIIGFGENPRADIRLAEYTATVDGSSVWATLGGHTLELAIGAPGRHIAENALAVLGAVSVTGADLDLAIAALSTLKAEEGRGRKHRLQTAEGPFTLIDESYNATPASMRAAIALLSTTVPEGEGRQVAILGDMLEMGEFSADVHAGLADPLLSCGIEHVWLAGPDMAALRDALPDTLAVEYRPDATTLTGYVLDHVRPGDVLMIKSSKGTGFSRIVSALIDKFGAVPDRGAQ